MHIDDSSSGAVEAVSPRSPPPNSNAARIMNNEWAIVQKKTFTKWVNTQLNKRKLAPLVDLSEDFSDGVKLLQLLEIIGDESLGKFYTAPKHRVQKCENMNRALAFIKGRGVSLTNIGAEDLVDKNEKLVLGMIWTIILRFTIAEISEEGLTAKEGLLLWCQRKTAGYKNVSVKDFTFSWQDGLALCALIHRHRPDLLDFDKLDKKNKRENVALAFDVAEKHLNIPKLLDVEDLTDISKPDERSVMTYVAQYFHAFSSLDKVEVAGRRVGKFVGVARAAWEMQHDYEHRARTFINDVAQVVESWSLAVFDGTYADAKEQSQVFLEYKSTLKREWVTEKRELDTLLGNILTKLKTYKLAPYTPPADLAFEKVDGAWLELLSAEAARRKAINSKIQSIREELRVRYSELANNFAQELNKISQSLGLLTGELEQQLSKLRQLAGEMQKLKEALPEIKTADALCTDAGVDDSDRDYTTYSVDDLIFDFGVVEVAIQKKGAFVENQIVARSMTNITPQQLEEFESSFRAFDKDNSNALSLIEFKGVLASLGNVMDEEDVKKSFHDISQNAETINFEQFTNFMVSITEDKTTPEQLRQSFLVISGNKNYITEKDLAVGQMSPEQVEYLKMVLPKKDDVPDAYDFDAYLDKMFKH